MGLFTPHYILPISEKDKYIEYIENHQRHVLAAFEDNIDTFYEHFGCACVEKAENNIRVHDTSKFGQKEFEAYRIKFYPTFLESKQYSKESIEEMYDKAWIHHYHNNPHHPEYWLTFKDKTNEIRPIRMDGEYVIEMICDWESFNYTDGLRIGKSSAYNYYHTIDRKEGLLHNDTRYLVELVLLEMKDNIDRK